MVRLPQSTLKKRGWLVEALERSTAGHLLASGPPLLLLLSNCNGKVRSSPSISRKTYFLIANTCLKFFPYFLPLTKMS